MSTHPLEDDVAQSKADGVEHFPRMLFRAAKAWRRLMDARLSYLGLSQAKWLALVLLDKAGEGIKQRDLASQLGIECPTLVGLLDRMTADGWIERRASPVDRRANLVYLTSKAKSAIGDIYRTSRQVSVDLLGDIDREQLLLCEKLLATIQSRAADAITQEQR